MAFSGAVPNRVDVRTFVSAGSSIGSLQQGPILIDQLGAFRFGNCGFDQYRSHGVQWRFRWRRYQRTQHHPIGNDDQNQWTDSGSARDHTSRAEVDS